MKIKTIFLDLSKLHVLLGTVAIQKEDTWAAAMMVGDKFITGEPCESAYEALGRMLLNINLAKVLRDEEV